MTRAFLVLAVLCSAAWSARSFTQEAKGITVELDSLKSVTPADWKSEKPMNRLRSHQFRLPGVKDAKDAEVYIFPDLTNTVDQNFARYKDMFVPPEGKTVEDIAKTVTIMVGKVKVSVLDMEGTWLYKERPFDPKSKTEPRPNSRVISVIFSSPQGNYLIRLSGPKATVDQHAKAFFDWIKGFK